jgi:transcription termination factor NusB
MFKSLLVFIALYIWASLSSSVPCLVFTIFILLFGTLLSIYIAESSIIKKHLIAKNIFHDTTSLFYIVKSTWFTLSLSVFSAFVLSVAILITTIYLDSVILLVFGFDVLVIWLIYDRVKRVLASKVKKEFLYSVSRKWSVWINTLLLLIILSLYQFFVSPQNTNVELECEILNFLSSSIRYKELIEFKLLSISSGSFEYSKGFFIWLIYLLASNAVLAWGYSALLLSIDIRGSVVKEDKKRNFFLLGFIGVIVLLLLSSLIINHLYEKHHIQKMQLLVKKTYEKIDNTIDSELSNTRKEMLSQIDKAIDIQIDMAFYGVYQGIPNLSDYYYSIKGEYTRIALKGHDLFCGYKNDTLAPYYNRYLPNGYKLKRCSENMLNDEIESKIKKYLFIQSGFEDKMIQASVSVNQSIYQHIDGLKSKLDKSVKQIDIDSGILNEIESKIENINTKFDEVLEASSRDLAKKSISGGGAILLTTSISKTLMSKMLLKLGAKGAGKAASFAAGSVSGMSICAPSGPWALLCGVVTGTASWVGVDAAMTEIDQAFNEDDFQKSVSKMVDAEKNTLKALMSDSYKKWISELFIELKKSSDGLKSPHEQLQR